MELRNWKLHFPVSFDIEGYHWLIGKLSDFFVQSEPGQTLPLCFTCVAEGNIIGSPELSDGRAVQTESVMNIKRIDENENNGCDYAIETLHNVYLARYKFVDQTFRDEAWTYGTPGVN